MSFNSWLNPSVVNLRIYQYFLFFKSFLSSFKRGFFLCVIILSSCYYVTESHIVESENVCVSILLFFGFISLLWSIKRILKGSFTILDTLLLKHLTWWLWINRLHFCFYMVTCKSLEHISCSATLKYFC